MNNKQKETEKDRKIDEISFLYRKEKETANCELCKYWRERKKYFCVEHWAKFEKKRDEEIKKWEAENN